MTTLREAAQQALEALQAHGSHAPNCDYLVLLTSLPPQRKPCSCGLGANITALRAALAEPVEPTPIPTFPPVSQWKQGCAVCGIGADGKAYGYVCPRLDCPIKITCGGAV